MQMQMPRFTLQHPDTQIPWQLAQLRIVIQSFCALQHLPCKVMRHMHLPLAPAVCLSQRCSACDVQAKVQVPAAALQQAGQMFMAAGHSQCESFTVVLQSDFQERHMPLHLQSGASWLVSDLTASTRSLLQWLLPQ